MSATAGPVSALPQLNGRRFVTDGGLETDLIFNHGVDLPLFASFPLLDTDEGRALLEQYYDGYAAVARSAGAGLMLEAPTWRANPDWAAQLGYTASDLARVNKLSITFLAGLRDRYQGIDEIVIGGVVGPQGDGYRPDRYLSTSEAEAYHRPQVEAFAEAGADLVTAYTMNDAGEAAGVVLAAREVGLPVAVSFTVETDGRLPSGDTLVSALGSVDPDYFLVNCAHPSHIEPALATQDGAWRDRILGMRYNASTRSHAELDEATELDAGDLGMLKVTHDKLSPLLPSLTILGGCCGTDSRHVAALWGVA